MLSRLKIAVRINLLLALAAFGMLLCAGIGLWALRTQMLEEKRIQLQYVMDLVLNDGREDMKAAGGPQTGSGRAAFLEVLKRAKFGDSPFNFFFAYDYDGLVLWHPDPSKQGKNRSNVVYPNGKKMIPIFIAIGRSAPLGGFVDYDGPDNRGLFGPKLSHFRSVPELGVVVGVGANIKDVDAAFYDRLQLIACLFALAMLATGLGGVIISRSISEPLSNAISKIKRLANGDLDIAPANEDEKSELGEIDKALDVLRANAIEQRALQEKVSEQTELLMQQHKEAEERWRKFVDEVPVSMLMLDRNMVQVACSRRWVELAGLKDGHIGSYHYDIFPQIPEHWKETHRRALAGETVRAEEEMFVRLDGVKRWVRWEARPWLANDGTIGGITILSEDVTDRVLAVQALRENELRMRLAQEAAGAGTWESRPADKINVWSDSLWKLFGLEPGQCAPKREVWTNTIHPDDRERVIAEVNRAAAAGQAFEIQWRVNRPRGEPERWLFARGRPISEETPDNYFGVVIDITEQKRMEDALRESETRMRLAQEAAGVGAFEWRLADNSRHLTESLWRLYGMQKPEVWDSSIEGWAAMLHPADRESVYAAVMKAVSLGHDYEVESRFNVPKGEPERWFLTRGKPLANADGSLDRYFGVVVDITEQKLMEKALRESQDRQSFLLSLNDALRVTGDPGEAMATASKMLAQKLGSTQVVYGEIDQTGEHAVFSQGWNDGTIPKQPTIHKLIDAGTDITGSLNSGQTFTAADVRSDPRTSAPGVQAAFLRNSIAAFIYVPLVKDGRLAAILGVHRRAAYEWRKDEVALAQEVAERTWQVVERARVAHALRENELRLKFALAAGEAGTFELALDTWKIAACDQALALLNFPPGASMTLENVLARIYPDDLPAFQESLQRTIEGGACDQEWRTQLPDGSIRWLQTRGEKRSVLGKQVIAGLIQDVTRNVQQKEAVERAAKAKSEFLANMSHELRTPMHAILSFAKFGLKECTTANEPTLEEYFQIIHDSGKRLLGLLNDLLDLAKLESGKMVLKKKPDDFLSVIEHTKTELSALLDEQGITLNTKVLTENTNATFDKQRMIQVLINLISNSIKFSPKGSEICVTVMEGRSSGGADVLRCSVGDEGPGLPQDELETVFEKFTQSSDTKSGAGGTGLGLPICREIVKAHGGSIFAENRQSKGALFSFVVPRRQGA